MNTQLSIRSIALASAAMTAIVAITPAAAQTPASGQQQIKSFDIPSSSLSRAISIFAAQSGIQVEVTADGAAEVTTNAINGRYTVEEAFDRLVNGTGLSWHWQGQNRIVVSGIVAAANGGGPVLGAVRVEGAQAGGVSPNGFGPGAGANGSTDVTATENTGSLATSSTTVATKVPTRFNDVAQTVSSITQEQIKQQQLTSISSALNSVPGIALNYGAGGTASFLSRGFEVDNIVVDGGAGMINPGSSGAVSPNPLPFSATPDLSEYDHIDVLKGSNALYGGSSAPGGTISLQRKRPLDHDQIVFGGHFGSWNDGRIDLDATGPLSKNGHTRARFTFAYQDQDFFYDFANAKKIHAYGIIEQDLGPDTIVRAGASYEYRDSSGVNYDGLPRFSDGRDLDLPRSTNFSAPWATLTARDDEEFVQFDHQFGNDWKLKLSATRTSNQGEGFAPDYQGLGIAPNGNNFSHVTNYLASMVTEQYVADGNIAGTFSLFGLDQTFTAGADYQNVWQHYDQLSNTLTNNLNVFTFDPASVAAPALPVESTASIVLKSQSKSEQFGIYANIGLQPLAGLHLNGGLRYSNFRATSDGLNVLNVVFGSFVFTSRTPTHSYVKYTDTFTPTGSIVYDVTHAISVYVSYADTFQPVGAFTTAAGVLLPPERGRTIEGGVKFSGANGTLHATLSIFDIIQRNVPLKVSTGTSTIGSCCYVAGAAIHNQGGEVSVAGEITKNWQINVGYTYLHVDYNDVYQQYLSTKSTLTPISLTQQPKHQIKLWSTYRLPAALDRFQLSAGLRYESERLTIGSSCASITNNVCSGTLPYRFAQGAYGVADIGLAFAATSNIKLQLNLTNLTDKRYYATAGSANKGNFYGEPRKVLGSITMKY
jgi:TonB-dependent siderophore receptor